MIIILKKLVISIETFDWLSHSSSRAWLTRLQGIIVFNLVIRWGLAGDLSNETHNISLGRNF